MMNLKMSLDSKYNRLKEFYKLLINFKAVRPKNRKMQLKKAYKNDYDADDELNETKKKKFDYRQFELFDETDKKSKLEEKTNTFLKQIENREKSVEKKGFMKYFSYKLTALVNYLLSQNMQDLRKILDEIKQQKTELNKDERNTFFE